MIIQINGYRGYSKLLRTAVGLIFAIIIFVTCLQVICRYVFRHSLIWSEELVRFLVVWLCFIGAAVSSYDDGMMKINIITEKFSRPVQFVVYTLRQAAILGFCFIGSSQSIMLLKAAGKGAIGALPIPAYAWRLAGTVGLMLIAIMTVLRWCFDLRRFRRHEFYLKDADLEMEENAEDSSVASLIARYETENREKKKLKQKAKGVRA